MKKIIAGVVFLCFSAVSLAQNVASPSDRVKLAIDDILTIAQDNSQSKEQKTEGLKLAIRKHVDLQAAAQRVLATHWRKATKEQKIEFIRLFQLVLTNTYSNLLETYNNEKVTVVDEKIKKEKYATVDTIVFSGGKEIPVSYQLLNRGTEWKVYDFTAEGISLVRSFSSEYQSILRKEGVDGLNARLTEKLNTPGDN